jgi:hypothetical protein
MQRKRLRPTILELSEDVATSSAASAIEDKSPTTSTLNEYGRNMNG